MLQRIYHSSLYYCYHGNILINHQFTISKYQNGNDWNVFVLCFILREINRLQGKELEPSLRIPLRTVSIQYTVHITRQNSRASIWHQYAGIVNYLAGHRSYRFSQELQWNLQIVFSRVRKSAHRWKYFFITV